MKLMPWKRTEAMTSLQKDFDTMLDRCFGNGEMLAELPEAFRGDMIPPMNVVERENEWAVSLELPGMETKDVDIQLMGRQLVISGERKWKDEKKDKDVHRVESRFGAFRRILSLPEGTCTDPDAIKAHFDKGMLEVAIPKLEPTPTKKIPIR